MNSRMLVLLVLVPAVAGALPAPPSYSWLQTYNAVDSIGARIAPPAGFEREPVAGGSFAEWLRSLPLKTGRPTVLLHDGRLKTNQDAHIAVVNIDTGSKDLQQCADAVIRLRAEYLWSRQDLAGIHFDFTSGDTAQFSRWSQGFRPIVSGSQVRWERTKPPDTSYSSFREFLNVVFTYAGTASLSREMEKVLDVREVRAGDVFVEGGYPGHAVIIVDVAKETRTGRRAFLLAQSFMPAQDIHILKNPAGGSLAPWYEANPRPELKTPEWTFRPEHLRRF